MLPLEFTDIFNDSYNRIRKSDLEAVDAMLDRLEAQHGQPAMRDVIRVGALSLYATPRIFSRNYVYRVTWQYDNGDMPSAIICYTLAEVEVP